jgi:hypothetical protein
MPLKKSAKLSRPFQGAAFTTHSKHWTPQQQLSIVQQGMNGNVKVSDCAQRPRGAPVSMCYERKNLLPASGARYLA